MKTAIFGGSFNPLHNGHIALCRKAAKEYSFDKIVLLPSNNPPHKNDDISFDIKLEMLSELKKDPLFEICELEGKDDKVHYAVDMIPKLKEIYGDFIYLIGGDSMRDFDRWKSPEVIAASIPILVAGRGNISLNEIADKYNRIGGDIRIMTFDYDISSQRIRGMCELGEEISDYVTKPTKDIINKYNLYSEYKKLLGRIKERLDEERYEHTVGVALEALKLNEQVGLPFKKVFTAAILHDIAKNEKTPVYNIPKDVVGTKVMHAFSGAEIAKREFKITDEEVINAIKYHTTAKENMSELEMIIYLADMIERNRKYPEVAELRKLSYKDYKSGFIKGLTLTYEYLIDNKTKIYKLTKEAYDFYALKQE